MVQTPSIADAYYRAVSRLSRRELLNAAWKVGLAALAMPAYATRVFAQMAFEAYPFTLGVASGDPLPTGVVLWTRLAPRPLDGGGMPAANVEVAWEVARERAFTNVVQRGTVVARPELGHSVHVDVPGLEPAREYFYRFRAGREVSQVGRTKTAPAPGAAVDRLTFGVCGCSHYETGYFTAYRRLAQENFDFVFHTGDYIYEGRANGGQGEPVRQHQGQEIYTIVDYRNRYAQYKMDADLRAAHASAPFIVTWDDHEVDNDYADALDESTEVPAEVFLLRRAAAYQAYYEAMPLRREQFPTGPSLRLHRSLAFGSLIDFSALDTRQYRSDQVCGSRFTDCAPAKAAERTMLGRDQEKWLFDRLAGVRATWTVVGQQVPAYVRDLGTADGLGRFSSDKWEGYAAARDRLFSRLVETRAPNPIVLSGDVHQAFGADLKRDFARPDSETIGSEFTNTSITSGGDGADVMSTWVTAQKDNPHIKFHSSRRGYIACAATPATFRADFRSLDRVTVAGEPIKTAGSLVVEAGKRGAVKA